MKTSAEIARAYVERLGWSLVTIPAGSKAPTLFGWQQPEKAISTGDDAERYWTVNPTHNMGLLHAASGTVALDIDSVENTRIIFDTLGISYDAIMSNVPRIVGRPNRGKALFKVPAGLTLATHKISWPTQVDPRRTEVVFELRAGAVQDVLPPSIHPDTGNPYTWAGASVWDGLPDIPAPLLTIWTEWDRFRPQLMDACPWKPQREFQPPRKIRPQSEKGSVIEAFNAAHDMDQLLQRFGYKPTSRQRYLSPNSTSGLAGVVLFEDGKAYSHHASDPFDGAHTFDAFDLWCQYEHMGDVTKAVKDAALLLKIDNEPDHAYDAEAINHGAKIAASWRKPSVSETEVPGVPDHLLSIPGVLQDAVNFYATTAPKPQPQFAVQAALAFGSVVMGRRWVTDQRNFSGLYFVNVGVSAAGKEHSKTVLEKLLEASGLESLIGPSGYTSASGVFSALVQQPCHLTIIDELGRVLQTASAAGNHHKVDAQTILMEVFGRQDSTLRPQGYSKMGMTKKQADEFDKVVRSPSLTLMSMTTPSTLYGQLSSAYVKDGFLGRFVIVESPIGRQEGRPIKVLPPSPRLISWAQECAAAQDGNGGLPGDGNHEFPPAPVVVPFAPECETILRDFDREMLRAMDEVERFGMEAMFGRTKEIAQRLALIVSRSANESAVSGPSLLWAIDYARHYAKATVAALRRSMSDGPFEAACKAVLAEIGNGGLKGRTMAELSDLVSAFRNLEPRKRGEVLDTLASDHGVMSRNMNEGQKGRPRIAWYLPPQD